MPPVDSTNQFVILHDHNLPLCFVGHSHYNRVLYNYFSKTRPCVEISLEDLEHQSDSWRRQYQFISLQTHIPFKARVKAVFDRLNVKCFSVCSNFAAIGNNVSIGYNVIVEQFSSVWDDCVIGDFTTIACNVNIAHGASTGECCHISPYAHLCYVECGDCVFVGNAAFVWATKNLPITVCNCVNIQAFSRVLKSIEQSGTYYSNRMVDTRTSLDLTLQ
jgi:UDP-3-O-[3-hydroxymyristoyl] glucosamine N-acyltransferase